MHLESGAQVGGAAVAEILAGEAGKGGWPGAGPGLGLPALVLAEGEEATLRFLEYYAVRLRNAHTRRAYARAVVRFLSWCEAQGVERLREIDAIHVAGWVETHPSAPSTVNQHLAAVRTLFAWLVTGQVLPRNPAADVRGPRCEARMGSTPVLDPDQARHLFDSIDERTLIGKRDLAILGVMTYACARVSAVIQLEVGDYYTDGKRRWLRLHEKRGLRHDLPVHRELRRWMEDYLRAARIRRKRATPLFRTVDRRRELTERPMLRSDVYRVVKRRVRAAGLPGGISCHSFRATGITTYLAAGGTLEGAQAIAAHASPKTTKLYDRRALGVSLEEIERIQI